MKVKYLLPIALLLLVGCYGHPSAGWQASQAESETTPASSVVVEQESAASDVTTPTLHPLPADAIYQGPDEPPMLTDEQLAAYKRDGFVDIEGNAYPVMSAAYYNKLSKEENLHGEAGEPQCNMQYMASAIDCLSTEEVRMWWNSRVSWLNDCANLTADTNWLGDKMINQSAQRCFNRLATDNGWGNYLEMQKALSAKGLNVVSPAERVAAAKEAEAQYAKANPCRDAVIDNIGAFQQCFDSSQAGQWWRLVESDIVICIERDLQFTATHEYGGSVAAALEGSGEEVKRQCETEVAERAAFKSRSAMLSYLSEKGVRRQDTLQGFKQEWNKMYGSME